MLKDPLIKIILFLVLAGCIFIFWGLIERGMRKAIQRRLQLVVHHVLARELGKLLVNLRRHAVRDRVAKHAVDGGVGVGHGVGRIRRCGE